jgi:hypothetical protein
LYWGIDNVKFVALLSIKKEVNNIAKIVKYNRGKTTIFVK